MTSLKQRLAASRKCPIVFKCIVLELVPLRCKKLFGPRQINRILVPVRGSFQNFRRSPTLYGSPLGAISSYFLSRLSILDENEQSVIQGNLISRQPWRPPTPTLKPFCAFCGVS